MVTLPLVSWWLEDPKFNSGLVHYLSCLCVLQLLDRIASCYKPAEDNKWHSMHRNGWHLAFLGWTSTPLNAVLLTNSVQTVISYVRLAATHNEALASSLKNGGQPSWEKWGYSEGWLRGEHGWHAWWFRWPLKKFAWFTFHIRAMTLQ